MHGNACPHTQHTTAHTDSATYLTSKLENWAARLLERRSSNCGNAEMLCSLSTFPVCALSLSFHHHSISLSLSFHHHSISLFLFQTRCYRCTYNKDVLDYPVCVNAVRCRSWAEGSSMWSIATRTPLSPEGVVSPQTENQLL